MHDKIEPYSEPPHFLARVRGLCTISTLISGKSSYDTSISHARLHLLIIYGSGQSYHLLETGKESVMQV